MNETYRDLAESSCSGFTVLGQRCGRENPRPTDGEIYLCRQHLDQSPGGSRGWLAALDSIQEQFAAAQEVSRSITASEGIDRVYFVTDRKHLKIGTSINVAARLATIKSQIIRGSDNGVIWPAEVRADELVLVLDVAGGRAREQAFHQLAKHWHIEGEWFTDCRALRRCFQRHGVDLPNYRVGV